jgi:hypothetical protein
MATDIDVLVVENCLVFKGEQPEARPADAGDYRAQFPLD